MEVGANAFGVVDGIASTIHGCSIWEVADFIEPLLLGIRPRWLLIVKSFTDTAGSASTLLPIEGRRLDGRLASVPQLLLPTRVDLVGVLLEGQERALELLMRLGILDD